MLTDTVIEHVGYKVGQAIQKRCHLVRAVDVSHGVVRAEEDAEKSKQVLIWCRQLFNKLRKIKDKESDHGRHMKGFNKLKVREPMSQVVENDADTVSQRKDDDNLDEAVHTKYFDMPPLTVDEAIVRLGNVDHAMPSMVSGMLKGQDTEFEIK
ncbi:hypothetical protein Peur_071698 [Populus x canadensis]